MSRPSGEGAGGQSKGNRVVGSVSEAARMGQELAFQDALRLLEEAAESLQPGGEWRVEGVCWGSKKPGGASESG